MVILVRTLYAVVTAFLAYTFIAGIAAIEGEATGFIYSGLDSGVTWTICMLSGVALIIALCLLFYWIPPSDSDDDESGYIVHDFRGR